MPVDGFTKVSGLSPIALFVDFRIPCDLPPTAEYMRDLEWKGMLTWDSSVLRTFPRSLSSLVAFAM